MYSMNALYSVGNLGERCQAAEQSVSTASCRSATSDGTASAPAPLATASDDLGAQLVDASELMHVLANLTESERAGLVMLNEAGEDDAAERARLHEHHMRRRWACAALSVSVAIADLRGTFEEPAGCKIDRARSSSSSSTSASTLAIVVGCA